MAEFRPEHRGGGWLPWRSRFASSEGQVIFHEGDDYSVFYLLVEGMVALELETPGHVMRVQTLYAGDEFDWRTLLPHGASTSRRVRCRR